MNVTAFIMALGSTALVIAGLAIAVVLATGFVVVIIGLMVRGIEYMGILK